MNEPALIARWYKINAQKAIGRLLTATLVATTGLACGGGGTVGLCVVQYEEPLFTITRTTNAATGAAIPQVSVRTFSYNELSSAQLGIDFLTRQVGLTPRNVVIRNGEVVCTITCAFGGPEGRYSLVFGATGFRDTTVVINGKYGRGWGNCPTTLSDGLDLTLTLTPE